MKIAVVGTGYVGLSSAVFLSRRNEVVALEIIREKVDMLDRRESPIQDDDIERFLRDEQLELTATLEKHAAYKDAEYVIVATPTNYHAETSQFDTRCVEAVIQDVTVLNPKACIVVRSTIPVGFINTARRRYETENLIFCPEFLGEGKCTTTCIPAPDGGIIEE